MSFPIRTYKGNITEDLSSSVPKVSPQQTEAVKAPDDKAKYEELALSAGRDIGAETLKATPSAEALKEMTASLRARQAPITANHETAIFESMARNPHRKKKETLLKQKEMRERKRDLNVLFPVETVTEQEEEEPANESLSNHTAPIKQTRQPHLAPSAPKDAGKEYWAMRAERRLRSPGQPMVSDYDFSQAKEIYDELSLKNNLTPGEMKSLRLAESALNNPKKSLAHAFNWAWKVKSKPEEHFGSNHKSAITLESKVEQLMASIAQMQDDGLKQPKILQDLKNIAKIKNVTVKFYDTHKSWRFRHIFRKPKPQDILAGTVEFRRTGAKNIKEPWNVFVHAAMNDHTPELMKSLVERIVSNPKKFPGVQMAKLTGLNQRDKRADGLTLVTNSETSARKVAEEVNRCISGLESQSPLPIVYNRVPLMSRRISDGVAIGGGKDFVAVRQKAITSALEQAHTKEEFVSLAQKNLKDIGIDMRAPDRSEPREVYADDMGTWYKTQHDKAQAQFNNHSRIAEIARQSSRSKWVS